MPVGNYKVHFGIKAEDRELVVPGVAGIPTSVDVGSWSDWDRVALDNPSQLHISVVTDNPLPMLTRVLSNYGSLLLPKDYDDDGNYRGAALVIVSSRWDVYEQGYEGCFTVYAGQHEKSARVAELEESHNG